MGQIFNKEDDESQAFHYHLESYRHYPVSLDVISWLGVWYVKSELYEKAIHFFERASQIQPNEVKWRLMVTSCYRRMHNYQKALELYERIHAVSAEERWNTISNTSTHPHLRYKPAPPSPPTTGTHPSCARARTDVHITPPLSPPQKGAPGEPRVPPLPRGHLQGPWSAVRRLPAEAIAPGYGQAGAHAGSTWTGCWCTHEGRRC